MRNTLYTHIKIFLASDTMLIYKFWKFSVYLKIKYLFLKKNGLKDLKII